MLHSPGRGRGCRQGPAVPSVSPRGCPEGVPEPRVALADVTVPPCWLNLQHGHRAQVLLDIQVLLTSITPTGSQMEAQPGTGTS